MKYHKIRGVPLEVCTAEQKIAYNIAFANADWLARPGVDWRDEVQKICARYAESPEFRRYDIDAVFCALSAGMENYMRYPFIASNYAEIGSRFPVQVQKEG